MAQQTDDLDPLADQPVDIEVVDDTAAAPMEGAPTGDAGTPSTQTDADGNPLHPEMVNLAFLLPQTELDNLAREVIDDYEVDLQSRTAWDEQHKLWTELYYQTDYAATTESMDDRLWGATESMPILTEAANQFAARGRKTFFPTRDFISAIVASMGKTLEMEQNNPGAAAGVMGGLRAMVQKLMGGAGDAGGDGAATLEMMQKKVDELRKRAERVAKHMNFQTNYDMQGYKEDKVALFLSTAVHGMMFTKVYPDYQSGKYVPKVQNVRGVDLVVPYMVGPMSMEDLPRKTHKLFPTVLETEMLARSKFFTGRCKAAQDLGSKKSGEDHAADAAEGLNGGTDTDDQSLSRQAFVLECHRFYEIDDPANPSQKVIAPVIVWVDFEARKVKRLAIRYETDEAGNPTDDRRPIEYFTAYRYFPNPDGFYGYGLGQMVGQINSAANITFRQASDAATLANDGNMSGFISNRLAGEDGEEVVLELGKFVPVPDTVGDIQAGIFQFKFPGPSEATFKILDMLVSYGSRLGGSTEAVTGTMDKVVQPTTLLTQLEQSLELPSSVMMGIAQSLGEELMKVYRMNRLHLRDKMYFIVDDQVQEVTPEDYAADLRIQPQFDAKMVVKAQRVSLAQAELQGTMQNPNNQGRPQVMDAAFRRYFEALEVDDIDELLPPPPPVERIDDQNKENVMFLMPQHPPFDVFPDQDHTTHLEQIDAFMKTPYGTQLTPPAAQELMAHRQKHMAYLYAQQTGVNLDGNGQAQAGGPGQGAAPAAIAGLGTNAGNPDGFGPVAPALPGAEAPAAGGDMGATAPPGGPASGGGGFDQAGRGG